MSSGIHQKPIEYLAGLLGRLVAKLPKDSPVISELVEAADLADGLLNSNLTNQANAIAELKAAKKRLVKFYDS